MFDSSDTEVFGILHTVAVHHMWDTSGHFLLSPVLNVLLLNFMHAPRLASRPLPNHLRWAG